MPGYTEYVLAEGSFSYGQAVAVITASVPANTAGTAALKRIPVVKCRIFPVCWPCLLNVVRTVLARMSG